MTHDLDWPALAKNFTLQAGYCALDNASPSSAAILRGCARALGAVHPLRDILATWHDHRRAAAVPLRVLGALHRLAMEGLAPDLAAYLPSLGGRADPDRVWPVAERTLVAHASAIADGLTRAPQTNEVGRSAALFGGFLDIAAHTKRPLRLLEIGTSAGLNLCWDRYRIEAPNFAWGPPDSPLRLRCDWTGPAPHLTAPVTIVERSGCDLAPVDIGNADDRRRMESYVWTDQVDRLRRLRTAIAIAAETPRTIERADAAAWVARQLSAPAPGVTTVLFHSIMWPYLEPATAAAVESAIRAAGARATTDAPLAWLLMEAESLKSFPTVSVTLWPEGQRRSLGSAHFHGNWIKWGAADNGSNDVSLS